MRQFTADQSVIMLPLVISLAISAILQMVKGELDCQGNAVMTSMKSCFDKNGIEALSFKVEFGGKETGGSDNAFMDSFMMRPPEEFCSKKLQFKSALECVMAINNECVPEEIRGYLPQEDMMKMFLDELCEKVTYTDGECVLSKQQELHHCIEAEKLKLAEGILKRSNSQTKPVNNISKWIKFNCRYYISYTKCLKNEAISCGCNITSLYQHLIIDILYPLSCPRPVSQSIYACTGADVRWSSVWPFHILVWLMVILVLL